MAVFAKAPVAGSVKTRLAAAIGAEAAASLHAELVRRALATAAASLPGAIELWCSPDERDPFFARCASDFGVRLRAQRGADLGERMRSAFESAFSEGAAALVIIGADCPALGPADVRAAIDALTEHEAVFAPAEDGGYVLVGLARVLPALFDAMAWGGSGVMEETRARLVAGRVRWKELATLWDVDRLEDYERMLREGLLQKAPA